MSGRADAVRRSQPLRREPRARVNVDLAKRAVAGVLEAVRLAGRDDDDVARLDDERLVAEEEGRLALLDDEDLLVGMAMQGRALPRLGVDEQERHVGAVFFAHELARDDAEGQGVLPDDLDCGICGRHQLILTIDPDSTATWWLVAAGCTA